jgi:hypothetical protein
MQALRTPRRVCKKVIDVSGELTLIYNYEKFIVYTAGDEGDSGKDDENNNENNNENSDENNNENNDENSDENNNENNDENNNENNDEDDGSYAVLKMHQKKNGSIRPPSW